MSEKPEDSAEVASADEPKVVDLDRARSEAREEGRAEAQAHMAEVTELCRLAGKEALAAQFIEKGTAVAEVRKALLAKAEESEATAVASSLPLAVGPGGAPQINAQEIYARRREAMKAR